MTCAGIPADQTWAFCHNFLSTAITVATLLQGCCHLTNLTLLELGANRLATVDGLDSFPHLRELWLGSNRIAENPSLSWYSLAFLQNSDVSILIADMQIISEDLHAILH